MSFCCSMKKTTKKVKEVGRTREVMEEITKVDETVVNFECQGKKLA